MIIFSVLGGVLYFEGSSNDFVSKGISKDDMSKLERADFQFVRDYWRERMDGGEAGEVYRVFKDAYESVDFGKQHAAAHIIGELLYEKEGVDGLVVCDNTFAFGCFHGFFGNAIQEGGIGTIAQLDSTCLDKYGPYGTGCQHGIGHGILEYLGHDALIEGLEACEYTTQLQAHFGCTSGLFMEYNIPIVFSAEDVYSDIRDADQENLYAPCNTIVPDKFKKSCYFELAQWWMQIFNNDHVKIGGLCDALEDKGNKKSCYLGFGTVSAYVSHYDVDRTIALCKESSHGNTENELFCRASASWSFWAMPEHRQKSVALCENFIDTDTEYTCVQESDLIETGEKLKKE
ncbi:MAG: hypothetical protein WD509_00890 [Candidatus Paceibacterota bacterium]